MSPKLKLADFGSTKGLGVITDESVEQGQYICSYEGPILTYRNAVETEKRYDQHDAGSYMFFFRHPLTDAKLCVDATFFDLLPGHGRQLLLDEANAYLKSTGISRYLNHSRRGNMNVKSEMFHGAARLAFYASENIAKGTELTYDYGERRKEILSAFPWLLD